jgi:hypothetical protein
MTAIRISHTSMKTRSCSWTKKKGTKKWTMERLGARNPKTKQSHRRRHHPQQHQHQHCQERQGRQLCTVLHYPAR